MKKLLYLFLTLLLALGLAACDNGSGGQQQAAESATGSQADGDGQAAPTGPEAIARSFVDAFTSGRYEDGTEHFSAELVDAVPPDALEEMWTAMMASYGAYEGLLELTEEDGDGYTTFLAPLRFADSDLTFAISIADGEIIGLFVAAVNDREDTGLAAAVPPEGVAERAITVNEKGDFPLAAKLCYPEEAAGPLPAVVLVHGSGTHNMDERINRNVPFRDIAWGLAQQGIAVLRYDKVTFTYGMEPMKARGFTIDAETVTDAVYAKETLEGLTDIDFSAIYVAGHSLGGCMAPKIAELGDYDGMILLAGSPRSLIDIIADQQRYFAGLADQTDEERMAAYDYGDQHLAELREAVENGDEDDPILGGGVTVSYIRSMDNNPAETYIRQTKKPMLILQGEADFQITMEGDFALYQAMTEGMDNVERKSYPGLNHLFMTSTMEFPTTDEYLVQSAVDGQVIEDIAAWILAQG